MLLSLCAQGQLGTGSYNESNRVYSNPAHSFSCKVPVGWVLRTEQMQPDAEAAKAGNQVLLAAFERPPEATGPAPASTILIASEPQSAYPALKTAEDYFAPLAEVITAKGFQPVNDPYPFKIGARQILRQDFSREEKPRPTTYQSTFVLLSHKAIVSFTFIAATEDEVDTLIENLSLSSITPKSPPKTAPAKKIK